MAAHAAVTPHVRMFTKGCCSLTPNGAPRVDVLCEARREIGEKLAAVVVHAPTGPDDDLVVEPLRAPGDADARRETPLAPRERGVADPGSCGFRIISGDDQCRLITYGIRRWVVGCILTDRN